MAFGWDGLVVIDGPQAELGLQGAEDRFAVGQGDIGALQGGIVALGVMGAQAVHARMGPHRAGQWPPGEANGGGVLSARVGIEFDVVVLGESSLRALSRPMRCQPWSMRLWVRGLESPSESSVRACSKRSTMARSLAAALFGEAVQARLLAVVGHGLVQMHVVVRCGVDAHGLFGVEVAGAFAQPAPGGALGAGPGHAREDRAEGGGAHRGPEAQLFEHGGQCELVHGPQADVLHTDRAGADERQGVAVDGLEVVALARRRGGAPMRSPASSAAVMRWACASSAGGQSGGKGS